MHAMRLLARGRPLTLSQVALPPPAPGELLVRVEACGVCRTDLHLLDGELADIRCPITPGHEVVGVVSACAGDVTRFAIGDRVGVPWLAWTCGVCEYCRAGLENLCPKARFTGYTRDGGYAEEILADARYCLPLPHGVPATELAPLLCAGLIGYRAYRKAGEANNLGLYGFGAAAHLLAQIARHEGRRIFAFTRDGDHEGQAFAVNSAPCGLALPANAPLRNSMRRFCSHQWVRSSPPRSPRCGPVAAWCAPGFT